MHGDRCGTKHRHSSKEKAYAHIRRMKGDSARFLQPYFCEGCGYWHVGHQPGTISKMKSHKRRK